MGTSMAIIFWGGGWRFMLPFSADFFSFDLFSPYWVHSVNASLGYRHKAIVLKAYQLCSHI